MPRRDKPIIEVEHGSALYPQRDDKPPGTVDAWITERYGNLAARFEREAPKLRKRAEAIAQTGEQWRDAAEESLSAEASRLSVAFRRQGFTRALVDETLALVSELAGRTLGMRPYPVQLMGALALTEGRLAEMATGEGKTLTAALAASTAALAGFPTHVVTVNDYLAERDADTMRPLYERLRLSVGMVKQGQKPPERRAAYAADVTYAVNREIAFDYQRDRLAMGRRRLRAHQGIDRITSHDASGPQLLLRGLFFAIIDEADSILIDEARTPLVIAGPGDEDEVAVYHAALWLGRQLELERHARLHPATLSAELTMEGSEMVRMLMQGRGGIWEARRGREELARQALAALHIYKRDRDYVIVDGKAQIVDHFTGRIADGRQWQNGLHQLIEVKENVEVSARTATQSSITYQRFFRHFLHFSGMSGTLAETLGELRAVYGLSVVRIPTNRPPQRIDLGVRLFKSDLAKEEAIRQSAVAAASAGRPVLIGTSSVRESRRISEVLTNAGVDNVLLNALNDAEEAAIIAEAGKAGRITVATSMAGRGTDIKLTPEAKAAGGLHVILSHYAESARVDRQLIGRGGRQGEPSTFTAILSVEDELFRTHAPALTGLLKRWPAGPEGELSAKAAKLLRRVAQKEAERLASQARADTLRRQKSYEKTLAFAGRG